MELILKFKELLLILLCVWQHSHAMSLEPKYSKFEFLEQLLEKVVRVELYAESIETLMLKSMKSIYEISNNTNVELSKMTEKLDTYQAEMEHFQKNMTSWNDKMETINVKSTRTLVDIEKFKSNLTAVNKEFIDEMTAWQGKETVAFNVYTTYDQTLTASQPVVFNKIRLNTCDDCYDTTTGYFTAPVSGIYLFNSQLCSNTGGDLQYKIVVGANDVLQGQHRVAQGTTHEKCTSFSAVHNVNKGEQVSIRGYNTRLDGGTATELSFSGVLVKAL